MEHSEMFESLKAKYQLNFVSLETLRGWVKINKIKPAKGITAEEFEEITGIVYVA